MLSCPVRLSEGPTAITGPSSPPRRVTSFAELAKGRKKAAGSGSPPLRASTGDSSQEFSLIQEAQQDRVGPPDEGTHCSHSLPPMPLEPGMDLVGPEPWSTQVCQGSQSSEMPPAGLRAAGQGPLAQLMDPGPALPGSPANSHTQRDARAKADGKKPSGWRVAGCMHGLISVIGPANHPTSTTRGFSAQTHHLSSPEHVLQL